MMLECSTGELLARAAFMHHDDQGHDALRHDAALKGLMARKHIRELVINLVHKTQVPRQGRQEQTEPGGRGVVRIRHPQRAGSLR